MIHLTYVPIFLLFFVGEPLPSQPDGDRRVHCCPSCRIGCKVPRIDASDPSQPTSGFEQLRDLYQEPQRLSRVEGATRVNVRRGAALKNSAILWSVALRCYRSSVYVHSLALPASRVHNKLTDSWSTGGKNNLLSNKS